MTNDVNCVSISDSVCTCVLVFLCVIIGNCSWLMRDLVRINIDNKIIRALSSNAT